MLAPHSIVRGRYDCAAYSRAICNRLQGPVYCDIFRRMRNIFLLFAVLILGAAGRLSAQSTDNPLGLKPHHATAAVADLDRAVRWYEQMLGFRVVNRGDRPDGSRFADLEMAGFGIGLVQNPGR